MSTLNRKVAPRLQAIDEIKYLKPKHAYMNNGVPVYCIRGGAQDIVKIEVVFKVGSFHQKKPLVAYTAANLLKAGTINKSSTEINYIWDYYGASLQIEAQKDIISIGFYCLLKHINPLLELFGEIISKAIFPQDELDIFIKNRLQKFVVDSDKVSFIARSHFSNLLFGDDHPYGNILKEDDFKNVSREDVLDYYNEFLHPANAVCLIAGNYPDNILSLLNTALDPRSWGAKSNLIEKYPCPNQNSERKHFFPKKDAVQSAFRIGKHMIGRSHSDYHKLLITNVFLGGYFGSRLMRNIRQDKGFTYGINSAIVSLMKSSYFFISSQVGKEVREIALDEVYKEIVNIRKKPASSDELKMMKNYLLGALLRSFDGPFAQTERFKEILLFNQDYSFYTNQIHTLQNITPKQIQLMGEKYFDEDSMLEVIAG